MEQKILSLKDDKINSEVELFEYPEELRGGRNYILTPKDIVSNSVYRRVRIENGIVYWEQLSTATSPHRIALSQPLTKGDYVISFKTNTNEKVRPYINTSSGSNHFSQSKVIQINENEWLVSGLLLELETSTTLFNIYGTEPFEPTKEVMFWDFKLEKGTIPTPWSPAPEDLNLSYPDFITEFKPSISDRYILTEELIEYPVELIGGRNYFCGRSYDEIIQVPNYGSGEAAYGSYDIGCLDASKHIGDNFTISFWIRSPQGTATVRTYSINGSPRYFRFNNLVHTTSLGSEWQFFKRTVLNRDYGEGFVVRTRIELYSPDRRGLQIKNIKVEKGSTATPWTPAPEDLDLSYPDHIQSFGTSFSNNILINEFIEQ